jgi:hypothetical protein
MVVVFLIRQPYLAPRRYLLGTKINCHLSASWKLRLMSKLAVLFKDFTMGERVGLHRLRQDTTDGRVWDVPIILCETNQLLINPECGRQFSVTFQHDRSIRFTACAFCTFNIRESKQQTTSRILQLHDLPKVMVEWLALLLRIREIPVPNLDPETGNFCGFPPSLQDNALKFSHDRFLLNPSQLISHLSPFHSTPYSLSYWKSVVN